MMMDGWMDGSTLFQHASPFNFKLVSKRGVNTIIIYKIDDDDEDDDDDDDDVVITTIFTISDSKYQGRLSQ